MLGVDENDELIDPLAARSTGDEDAAAVFPQMILENLKTAGVQQAHKEDRITFTALAPWPGDLGLRGRPIHGRGDGETRRHLHRPRVRHRPAADLVAAAREAAMLGSTC